MSDEYSPAFTAVEHERLDELTELLRGVADPEEYWGGISLLQQAIDIETIMHESTGEPLRGDMTAAILAAGADPLRPIPSPSKEEPESARDMAVKHGHHIAVEMFDAWAREHRPDVGRVD